MGQVIGKWRKVHNEELNELYSSSKIVWVIKLEKNEMGGACSEYGERRGVYRVLVAKPEGKRTLGRPRHNWEESIKMDLQGSRMRGYGLDRTGSG
jgi:hypothetical protein